MATLLPPKPAARLAGTWNVCQDDDAMDFFSGLPGKGRQIFLWCRRFGTGDATKVSTGVTIDSDLLFVGNLEGDDARRDPVATSAAGVAAVGWTTEPCFTGVFALKRASGNV